MYDQNEIEAIVNTPNLSLLVAEKAWDVLVHFYVALGWDKTMILDPTKVITTKSIFDYLSNLAYAICPDSVGVGMIWSIVGQAQIFQFRRGKSIC